MMKLSLRFVLPLLLAVAMLAYFSVPLLDRLTLRWFMSDLDQRSQAVATTLSGPLREAHEGGQTARVAALLNAAAADERLQSAALCAPGGEIVARSAQFPPGIGCVAAGDERVLRLAQGVVHATRVPLRPTEAGGTAYKMVVLHDMSFVELRSSETRWYAMGVFAVLGLVVALVTVAVAHLSWRGWVRGVRDADRRRIVASVRRGFFGRGQGTAAAGGGGAQPVPPPRAQSRRRHQQQRRLVG
jgi:trehalose 6-phosphate synthase